MRRRILDGEGHALFVTFSCYRRRKILDDDRARGIVIHFLGEQLRNQKGTCHGFVIMPDHVHALVGFEVPGMMSTFMNQWKRRSSMKLKELYQTTLKSYGDQMDLKGPMWQAKYYAFNVYSKKKVFEKLDYMHDNPVKAGLVKRPEQWRHSSAGWYLMNRPVGVPITPAVGA